MGNYYFGDAARDKDETLDHHMAFTRLRQHWNSLRDTVHRPPKARDLQPHILGAALPFVFLVENLGGEILRLKLGGTHLCDVMGMELRGMPLRCFFAYNERPRFAAAVEPVFTGPAELDIRLQSSYSEIEPPVLARMILLPLQSASGMIDRAIGAFVTKGPLNHAPYRFEIERAHGSAPASCRNGGCNAAAPYGHETHQSALSARPVRGARRLAHQRSGFLSRRRCSCITAG